MERLNPQRNRFGIPNGVYGTFCRQQFNRLHYKLLSSRRPYRSQSLLNAIRTGRTLHWRQQPIHGKSLDVHRRNNRMRFAVELSLNHSRTVKMGDLCDAVDVERYLDKDIVVVFEWNSPKENRKTEKPLTKCGDRPVISMQIDRIWFYFSFIHGMRFVAFGKNVIQANAVWSVAVAASKPLADDSSSWYLRM